VQDAKVDARGAVEAAYRAEWPRMWRALLGFTGDPEIASDALAEAFARALRHEPDIRNLVGWLWRVSFRLAADELKHRSAKTASSNERTRDYTIPEPVPELVAALRALSTNQRLAVVLHDYADRPNREVAETLGCSVATVHVHLSQARRRLRKSLEGLDD
jgi:RNA polymerase sigma-70 factor (ECF subfamily)